jgi:hypothetical protein
MVSTISVGAHHQAGTHSISRWCRPAAAGTRTVLVGLLRPSRTSKPCCLGAWHWPIADQHPALGVRARSIDRLPRTGVGDLIRVHVMLLRQLGQRLVPSYGGQRHLGLECRRVRAAGSSAHACSSSLGRNPRPQEQCPPSLIGLFRFAGPALPASTSRTRRKRTNDWTNSVCGDDQPPIVAHEMRGRVSDPFQPL